MHRPYRKHGEPPNSDVELARCGVGRVFVRYSDACASLICGADFGAVSVPIVSINSRSTWVLNSESMWI